MYITYAVDSLGNKICVNKGYHLAEHIPMKRRLSDTQRIVKFCKSLQTTEGKFFIDFGEWKDYLSFFTKEESDTGTFKVKDGIIIKHYNIKSNRIIIERNLYDGEIINVTAISNPVEESSVHTDISQAYEKATDIDTISVVKYIKLMYDVYGKDNTSNKENILMWIKNDRKVPTHDFYDDYLSLKEEFGFAHYTKSTIIVNLSQNISVPVYIGKGNNAKVYIIGSDIYNSIEEVKKVLRCLSGSKN